MNVITCKNITKRFKLGNITYESLSSISFNIEEGSLVGLIGPDGSGKGDLLQILAGLVKPEEGKATVLGFDTVKEAQKIQDVIGYMPQKFGLYENLTLSENLKLYAELHKVPEDIQKARLEKLLKMMNLERFPNRFAGKLSGGMKQKLALACALISEPKVMLLSDPSVGVDVVSRHELWSILKKVTKEQGTTILVTTSYMDEADFCDKVLVMLDNRIIAYEKPEYIREKASNFIDNPSFEHGFQVLVKGKVLPKLKREKKYNPKGEVVVHASNLVKRFGDFIAVNHTSFDVHKGEIFGLLGANGAGKTTTFRILCNLDSATEGEVKICGLDLKKSSSEARNKFGFVAQKFSLYTDLTVKENMEFFSGAYGLYGKKQKKQIEWALKEFNLHQYIDYQTSDLPLGIKQSLSMACALMHEPELLFLDEATSGADPITRRDFWKRIISLADNGVTIIITTHFLDEAEYCDNMIIMQDGKAVAQGKAEDIIKAGTLDKEVPENLEQAFINLIKRHES